MTDTVDEQLESGARAERQVQALLANERSLLVEIERLKLELEKSGKCLSCGTAISRDCPSCKRAWES